MARDQEPAAPQKPKQCTEEGDIGEVSTQGHSKGTNSARPKHGLLALQEPAGDPDTAET